MPKETFRRRAESANKKIAPIPRANTKAVTRPLPRANKSAAEQIEDSYIRLEQSDAAAWRRARAKKMRRKDI